MRRFFAFYNRYSSIQHALDYHQTGSLTAQTLNNTTQQHNSSLKYDLHIPTHLNPTERKGELPRPYLQQANVVCANIMILYKIHDQFLCQLCYNYAPDNYIMNTGLGESYEVPLSFS